MSNSKDLLKAVSSITSAYTEDLKELEELRRKLRRTERNIRDMSVELQYYAEQAALYTESRMDTQPPGYFDSPGSPSLTPELPPAVDRR